MVISRLNRLARAIWRPERASTSMVIFGILALILAGLSYLVATSYIQHGTAQNLLVEGSETLRTLRASTESGANAETGQRGYLLTGNKDYLQPYLIARKEWPALLEQLGKQDPEFDSERAEILSVLKSLQVAKLEELEQTIALYDSGDEEAALEIVNTGVGNALMEDYRLVANRYQRLLSTNLADDRLVLELQRGKPFILLGVLFLFILAMLAIGYVLERRRATAELRLEENKQIAAAHEQTALVARELNHRVNNLFSVVMSIVSLAARRHDDKQSMAEDIRERIHALSRAHSIARGEPAFADLPLDKLIETVLQPYRQENGERVRLPHSDVSLPAKAITPLGLILHELATNAVKYGALSNSDGWLEIVAEKKENGGTPSALVCWSEHGAEVELVKKGFGTTMMQAAAKQLGGEIEVMAGPDGLSAKLSFPIV